MILSDRIASGPGLVAKKSPEPREPCQADDGPWEILFGKKAPREACTSESPPGSCFSALFPRRISASAQPSGCLFSPLPRSKLSSLSASCAAEVAKQPRHVIRIYLSLSLSLFLFVNANTYDTNMYIEAPKHGEGAAVRSAHHLERPAGA